MNVFLKIFIFIPNYALFCQYRLINILDVFDNRHLPYNNFFYVKRILYTKPTSDWEESYTDNNSEEFPCSGTGTLDTLLCYLSTTT